MFEDRGSGREIEREGEEGKWISESFEIMLTFYEKVQCGLAVHPDNDVCQNDIQRQNIPSSTHAPLTRKWLQTLECLFRHVSVSIRARQRKASTLNVFQIDPTIITGMK